MIRVLLVDDEYYFRQAFKKTLSCIDEDLEIIDESINGNDALEKMKQADLVFLDINIPLMSGLDVLEKSRERGDQCAIIMVTAYSEFEYVKKAINHGALDYILKPIEKKELNRVLTKAREYLSKNSTYQIPESINIETCAGNFFSDSKSDSRAITSQSLSLLRRDFLISLRLLSSEKCKALIRQSVPEKLLTPDDIYIIMIEIISLCIQFCYETSVPFNNENVSQKALHVLASSASIDDVYSWADGLIKNCIDSFNNSKSSLTAHSQFIDDIQAYIMQHYSEPSLSVISIADHFSFNYHYLGKRFSQQTGIGLKKYISNLRINKAKELFDSGYQSPQQVCYMVGYDDPNYFSKCFKSVFGITPSQYIYNSN